MHLTKVADTLHGGAVLVRSGLVSPLRPGLALRSLVVTRKLGAIAGPATLSALRNPHDVAIIDDFGTTTYGDLNRGSNALARGLGNAGVGVGTTVGVLCRDHSGAVEAMLAIAKLGARLVLLNTGFAAPQLRDVALREQLVAIIVDEEFEGLLEELPEIPGRYLSTSTASSPAYPTVRDLATPYSDEDLPLPSAQGGLVLLTGGTTGTPKGAGRRVNSPLAAAQFLERVPQRRGDTVLIAAPTFHGTGLSQLIMALALGSTVVMQRRFDAEATIRNVARHKATVLVLVPTMLNRILSVDREVLDSLDTSSLRIIMTAGSALTPELGNRASARFGDVIHNLYGCTEVALATVAMPDDWKAAPGTVGRPPHGIKVALFDADDQLVSAPGAIGTIFVDNGLNFDGYSGGGSKRMIGAYMSTGDRGHWDSDGRLFVDGRDDDMIVSGGENVFPREIEDLVASLAGVGDVATTPVDDADFGTRLRMFVVADGSHPVDEELVKGHVRANLARFKVPREVWLVDQIPYTPTGKVDRRRLAEITAPTSVVEEAS